jgi:hypothetical protein
MFPLSQLWNSSGMRRARLREKRFLRCGASDVTTRALIGHAEAHACRDWML